MLGALMLTRMMLRSLPSLHKDGALSVLQQTSESSTTAGDAQADGGGGAALGAAEQTQEDYAGLMEAVHIGQGLALEGAQGVELAAVTDNLLQVVHKRSSTHKHLHTQSTKVAAVWAVAEMSSSKDAHELERMVTIIEAAADQHPRESPLGNTQKQLYAAPKNRGATQVVTDFHCSAHPHC